MAVQSVSDPGASALAGQVMVDRPGSGSVTSMGSRVTLPVFSTLKVYVMTSPSDSTPSPFVSASEPVLVSVIVGSAMSMIDSLSLSLTSGPEGGVPLADTVLFTAPTSTSAWVTR